MGSVKGIARKKNKMKIVHMDYLDGGQGIFSGPDYNGVGWEVPNEVDNALIFASWLLAGAESQALLFRPEEDQEVSLGIGDIFIHEVDGTPYRISCPRAMSPDEARKAIEKKVKSKQAR